MRMLMIASLPVEKFNEAVHAGSAGRTLQAILEEQAPEAVYFTELGGQRTAVLVVDLQDASEIPRYSEPWFLKFEADVEFHPVMSPQDLGNAGLDSLGKKWS